MKKRVTPSPTLHAASTGIVCYMLRVSEIPEPLRLLYSPKVPVVCTTEHLLQQQLMLIKPGGTHLAATWVHILYNLDQNTSWARLNLMQSCTTFHPQLLSLREHSVLRCRAQQADFHNGEILQWLLKISLSMNWYKQGESSEEWGVGQGEREHWHFALEDNTT